MSERNHDPHNPKQQAQGVFPGGRYGVNGAEGGPVSDGGKGGGNKSPPGNGKAPPPGNGAADGRSLDTRMAVLENEHKHLATKADLEKGLSGLRTELHATKTDLEEGLSGLRKELHDTELRLTKEAHATEARLSEQIQKGRDETRRMPYVILVGLAALMGIATVAPEAMDWLRGVMLG